MPHGGVFVIFNASSMDVKFGFLNIRSSFATIPILLEIRKWLRRPGDNAQRPPPLLHHLITQQVVLARPSGNHQWESAHLPTTTDDSSNHPTTDSKHHDRHLTIVKYRGKIANVIVTQ